MSTGFVRQCCTKFRGVVEVPKMATKTKHETKPDRIDIRCTRRVKQALRKACDALRKSESDFISQAIEEKVRSLNELGLL